MYAKSVMSVEYMWCVVMHMWRMYVEEVCILWMYIYDM